MNDVMRTPVLVGLAIVLLMCLYYSRPWELRNPKPKGPRRMKVSLIAFALLAPAGAALEAKPPKRQPEFNWLINCLEVQAYLQGDGPPPLWQWDGAAWQYSPDRKHLPTYKAQRMPWPKGKPK